jgi:C4-dicarboxylate transporter DctM subunit
MTLYVIGFVIAFFFVLLSGLPVGFGLGLLALGLMTMLTNFDLALTTSIDKAYSSMDSSILIAIPLFILAAQLISATGMGKRLFDAAKTLLGGSRSGLGVATIASSGVFSAMTGSSFVSASTMGLIAIPELRRAGYSDRLISSAITAGGSLGSVIPPSIVMIVYGYLTDESIGKLFMAGIVPGILLISLYSIVLSFFVRRELNKPIGVGKTVNNSLAESDEHSFDSETQSIAQGITDLETSTKNISVSEAFIEAFWGIMAPVIILGGIYLGVFTATEAAAVAVVYCMIIGFFVYKSLTIKGLINVLMEATSTSAMIAIIVIGGAILGHAIIYGRVPQDILSVIIDADLSPGLLMLVINIALFILGMFMEVLALMYLAIPLLLPLIAYMQWDNIWFAVIILINVNLALITPPLGGVLYVVSHIGNIPLATVIRGAMLPIVILLFTLLLVILYPPIATWLPSMMDG